MTGKLYIDGKDAHALYGVFATEGGCGGLACWPPLKGVESNDWAEEDGIEADLSAPVLDSRELDITFAHRGPAPGLAAFLGLLSDMAYHAFGFPEAGRTHSLRLVGQPDVSIAPGMGLFTLRFADDFPLDGYVYREPGSTMSSPAGAALDGRGLSDYGLCLLRGSEAEILKSPAVKKNLLRNIRSRPGAIYDGGPVVFQTKEARLNCLMRAGTPQEFWRNHSALLYDLVRPGERALHVAATGREHACHYKSCSVDRFFPAGRMWLLFSITLVFTSFRPGESPHPPSGGP